MTRAEAWIVQAANFLTAGTGLVYAWLRYATSSDDPFSAVSHPWQPGAQHLHLLVAPLLVFAIGLIFRAHVWRHFQRGVAAKRKSGLVLLAMIAPMILSGYLLQTTTADLWREIWVAVHLVSSGLWLLGYSAHYLSGRWPKRTSGAVGG